METNRRINGVMPLLMTFTTPSPIEESDELGRFVYIDDKQISYEMRVVGTRSLKSHTTRKKVGSGYRSSTDRANEIDDSKSVR